MKQKYLFLDVDGVLNCKQCFICRHEDRLEEHPLSLNLHNHSFINNKKELFIHFNGRRFSTANIMGKNHTDVLKTIVQTYNPKIVISSTWRFLFTLEEFKAIFSSMWIGVTPDIIGITPRKMSLYTRGDEIGLWLVDNNVNADDIVILDDDNDMSFLTSRLVKTEFSHGLNDIHLLKIAELIGE